MKAITSSAMGLFRCGHSQDIDISLSNSIHFRASCLPEMRKDRMYTVLLTIDSKSSDILQVVCGCPACKGPFVSCKHIGAVCFAPVAKKPILVACQSVYNTTMTPLATYSGS